MVMEPRQSTAPTAPNGDGTVPGTAPTAPNGDGTAPGTAPASEPEPTGIDKILVEQYGYEFVGGKAYAPGTAPAPSDGE